MAILGQDSYRADRALDTLLQERLGDEIDPDAVQVLRGDEVSWQRVLDSVRTGSLFVTDRIVVVRRAELLAGNEDAVVAALKDADRWQATLVLMAVKVDKRKNPWKKIGDLATTIDAEPLKGRAVGAWVATELRRRKLALPDLAVDELVEQVGQDLRRLSSELDKLEAFAGGRRLTVEDVTAVVGRGLGQPLYKLGDAFAAKRAGEVFEYVESALDAGTHALPMISVVHRTLRQLRGARALAEAKVPREAMAQKLGVLPFKVGDVLSAARAWSEEDVRAALVSLEWADRSIKTGSDPRLALTTALASALRGAGSFRPATPAPPVRSR